MIRNIIAKKIIACFFLCLLLVETLLPLRTLALTAGPSQPESRQFMTAGVSDMVDHFSGDLKYNVPLLDVDGYPVNLSYQSGVGMDDEASWVGLGWNLNAGAIDRQLRGLPDDFSGDEVQTEHYVKPKITVGGRGTVRGELKGRGLFGVGGSLSLGVFSDNYTGIGAEFGANAGISFSIANSGMLTGNLGLGVNSNTSSGVDVTPSISLSVKNRMNEVNTTSASISANLGYNTREGLKDLTLSQSFSLSGWDGDKGGSAGYDVAGSSISFNTPSFYPKIGIPFRSTNRTYSIDAGGAAFLFFAGGGVTGYKSKREIVRRIHRNPAFGFLYAERGKKTANALMDFMREKENPVLVSLPNLAMPVTTPDLFAYSGQAGSGQFRLYRGGSGVLFDAAAKDETDNQTLGGDVGFGGYFHGGITYYKQNLVNSGGKWNNDNDFLAKGDFTEAPQLTPEEPAYFKQVGEKNVADPNFEQRVQGEKTVSVALAGKRATAAMKDRYKVSSAVPVPIKKDGRQVRRSPVSYLTAAEAVKAALDKQIKSYPFNNASGFTPQPCNAVSSASLGRTQGYRRANHISELTVNGDDGKRMVYGIPVYNIRQDEYSFAANPAKLVAADVNRNLVGFDATGANISHQYGVDHYLYKESQPAYANAYLLTAVLSPDYVDVKGDGITDDDLGTAIKFNYSKVSGNYMWRSPYESGKALYNRALNADPDDDKASIVYGEKELWYLHSIETKTKIAYFITEDRTDALGVSSFTGGVNSTVKQKRLKEIRLYTKSDLTKPLKKVVLEYSYALCPGIPNTTTANSGKLTLTKLYFTYGSSTKGANHPYLFEYNTGQGYAYLATDRWGTLKPAANNTTDGFSALRNDEFPYATRNKAAADANAAMWHLSKITLPTGGIINVDYESDDYAYVQQRRSMEMTKVDALLKTATTTTTSLTEAKGFRFKISTSPPAGANVKDWFIREYLNGSPYLYMKLNVNVTDNPAATADNAYDFIPCYGKVASVSISGTDVSVLLEDMREGGVSAIPAIFSAWQRMRLEYPRYAYPGYKNRITDDAPVQAALNAIVNAIGNLSELKENFYEKARRKGFAGKVNLAKSFVRIVKADGTKLGGGVRVKRIRMADSWNTMVTGAPAATYGQSYEYTTLINGKTISSGVASYEPAVGNDENPMRMPVPYIQNMKGTLNNYFYLEEPFGETLFPAPTVGYSKVTVRNLNETGNPDPLNKTGWNTQEFYTAREFPVLVDYSVPDKTNYQPAGWFSFFGSHLVHELTMSQGYSITLNDMHGKPKAERVYNQSGAEISSVVYHYSTEQVGADAYKLKNRVSVMDRRGNIAANQVIGREIEMFTDMREQEMTNTGQSLHLGVDVIPFIFGISLPIPHWPTKQNDEYRLFRSACILKTIQYYGVVEKVVKTINGSSVTAANLVYDQYTGDPVVTQTDNEFGDPVYSVNIPAYWIYNQMGEAYRNLNTLIPEFVTNDNGTVDGRFIPYLSPGDELINIDSGDRMWVVLSATDAGTLKQIRLIDASGRIVKAYKGRVKVYRSGYRNQLTNAGATYMCLKNPVVAGKLALLTNEELSSYRILDAKTVLFDEGWGMPDDCTGGCPTGYTMSSDGTRCEVLPVVNDTAYLDICAGDKHSSYGLLGAAFFDAAGNETGRKKNSFWGGSCGTTAAMQASTMSTVSQQAATPYMQGDTVSEQVFKSRQSSSVSPLLVSYCGRLNSIGMWLCNTKGVFDRKWQGTDACFTAPQAKTYYIGFAGDNRMKIYIDGALWKTLDRYNTNTFTSWYIHPVTLSAGKHQLRIESYNDDSYASVGLEVYNLTYDELYNGTSATIVANTIFSTSQLIGQHAATFIRGDGNTTIAARYTCNNGVLLNVCDGTPNCGSIPRGSCPPGYTTSEDGQSCIALPQETSNSTPLQVCNGQVLSDYGSAGTIFYNSNGTEAGRRSGDFWGGGCSSGLATQTMVAKQPLHQAGFIRKSSDTSNRTGVSVMAANCGRLNTIGVWLCGGAVYDNNWVSMETCLNAPEIKTYYVGYGADNRIRIYIDGTLWRSLEAVNTSNFTHWFVYPLTLTAGSHRLRIDAYNDGIEAAAGVEVYNNTVTELMNETNIAPIYSTRQLVGQRVATYVRNPAGTITASRYSCTNGNALNVCEGGPHCGIVATGIVLNPYILGYMGNWLPAADKVYQVNRVAQSFFTAASDVNPRYSGYYQNFTPYWHYDAATLAWKPATVNSNSWITARTITLYDKHSRELENRDALGRYTAAAYGFKDELPAAVASNAMQREVFYDGFDDYKFRNLCVTGTVCQSDSFNILRQLGTGYASYLDGEDAHSGNYSLKLTAPILLNAFVHNKEHRSESYLSNNVRGEYLRKAVAGLYPAGFSPVGSKKYVFSVWVKDGQPLNNNTGITLKVNDQAVTLQRKATVDGWKLVEGVMDLPVLLGGSTKIRLALSGTGTVKIDDLRIFPFDAQMKTYAYSDQTLRVMAELDENNFATFYEYDDEGTLIRLKKETERGVMTIKESHSAYKKN